MSVGGHEVEAAVVVRIEKSRAEAEDVAAGRCQADRRGMIGEEPLPQVMEERRRFAVEVGDRQVGQGRRRPGRRTPPPCPPGSPPRRWPPRPPTWPHLLEMKPAQVAEEDSWPSNRWRRRDRPVHHHRDRRRRRPGRGRRCRRFQPRPSRPQTGRRRCGRHGPAATSIERGSHAIVIVPEGSVQIRGLSVIPMAVMADIEVEVAVVVQIGEGRRGRPVAVAARPALSVTSSNVPSPRL